MFRRRPLLPLPDDATNRFLPWIVALMVFLAALALAGGLVLDAGVARWRAGENGKLTVQVPPDQADEGQAAPGHAAEGERRVAAVLRALDRAPDIAKARALGRDELVALLEPWLGRGNVAPDLPLPRLIDVTLAPGASIDSRALERRLDAVVPGTMVEDHARWLDRLATAARAIQAVAIAVVAAIGLATVGTVVFTTRTSLAVHHDAIEILHLMGAQDGFIARAFARRALWLGLRGGLLGLGLAAVAMFAVRYFAGAVEAPLLPRLALDPAALAALAVLPVASALIAMLTARLTVLRALARMP